MFFTWTFWRVTTPFREVTFADFLLADILTSLAKALSDCERALCHLSTGPVMQPHDTDEVCNPGKACPITSKDFPPSCNVRVWGSLSLFACHCMRCLHQAMRGFASKALFKGHYRASLPSEQAQTLISIFAPFLAPVLFLP